MSTTDFVRALDDLLEGAPEAGADQSPDTAAELAMLAETAALVRGLGPAPAPRTEFRRALAGLLASAPAPSTLRPARRIWLWPLRRTVLAGVTAAAVVALAAAGAVSASASALPGDFLYPVKRAAERVRLAALGSGSLAYHLELAEMRLAEAAAVPGESGPMLSEFSREVTAGLASTDRALDAGASRLELAPALLDWLMAARGGLVAERARMSPLAWRGALALVDEAIAALRSDAPLAMRPVPRLEDARTALAQWSPPPTWLRPVRLLLGGPAAPLPRTGGAQPVVVVLPRATDAPPPADQPAQPVAGGERRSRSADRPAPTSTIAAAVPSPTATGPEPTPEPSATPQPTNAPPVITVAWCSPNPVVVYDYANCAIEVQDEDAAGLSFVWTADAGQLLRERTANPIYYASFDHGVKETSTWIHVQVADAAGVVAEHRFLMRIVALPQSGGSAARRADTGP